MAYDQERRALPGAHDPTMRAVLIEQLVESVRRVNYVSVLHTRELSPRRMDPDDDMFDPVRAAILHKRSGDVDESVWLVFLFVHFGKHPRAGWRYLREIYGRLGDGTRWDWIRTSSDPSGFRDWLHAHEAELRRSAVAGGFGNHRKYQSLDAYSPTGTGAAVASYVNWVAPPRTHEELFADALARTDGDRHRAFHDLYVSMQNVASFGRLARFDYLTMVGKLGLAPIAPGSTYMQNSTGPIQGARLLFGTQSTARELDNWLAELDSNLHVGMQVLEDALCNWQKSPASFAAFRG